MSAPAAKNPQVANAQNKAAEITNQILSHPYVKQANNAAQQQLLVLDKQLSQFPILNDIEAKTKIPKTYGVLSISFVTALLIYFNLFGLGQTISLLVGYIPAAFFSAKALETKNDSRDDTQWLTYWLIFGLFTCSESLFLRPILYYFPLYFVAKTVFIIWLMLPQTRGAEVMYRNVVSKVFATLNQSAKAKPASPPYGGAQPYSATTTSTFDHEKSL